MNGLTLLIVMCAVALLWLLWRFVAVPFIERPERGRREFPEPAARVGFAEIKRDADRAPWPPAEPPALTLGEHPQTSPATSPPAAPPAGAEPGDEAAAAGDTPAPAPPPPLPPGFDALFNANAEAAARAKAETDAAYEHMLSYYMPLGGA